MALVCDLRDYFTPEKNLKVLATTVARTQTTKPLESFVALEYYSKAYFLKTKLLHQVNSTGYIAVELEP